jgi:hypothetical protein
LRLLGWLRCGLLRLDRFGRLLSRLRGLLRNRLGRLLLGLGGLCKCGHGNFLMKFELQDWKN